MNAGVELFLQLLLAMVDEQKKLGQKFWRDCKALVTMMLEYRSQDQGRGGGFMLEIVNSSLKIK